MQRRKLSRYEGISPKIDHTKVTNIFVLLAPHARSLSHFLLLLICSFLGLIAKSDRNKLSKKRVKNTTVTFTLTLKDFINGHKS